MVIFLASSLSDLELQTVQDLCCTCNLIRSVQFPTFSGFVPSVNRYQLFCMKHNDMEICFKTAGVTKLFISCLSALQQL